MDDARQRFCSQCGQALQVSASACTQCGAPQAGAMGAPYFAAGQATRTSGMAIASMVLGILWCYWVGSILAVIFGHISLGQIKRGNGAITGKGMAIAGLVLGYIGIASIAVVLVIVFLAAGGSQALAVG